MLWMDMVAMLMGCKEAMVVRLELGMEPQIRNIRIHRSNQVG